MKVQKIHIKTLITALSRVYDLGIDFVDLIGRTEEDGVDSVTLRFAPYYTEENIMYLREEEETKKPPNNKIKLSDEDLNQLM